jgi:hypothetical protein
VTQLSTKRNRTDPSEEELFEESLRQHGQLAEGDSDEPPPDATHHVETNDKGERTVRRDRFSAI